MSLLNAINFGLNVVQSILKIKLLKILFQNMNNSKGLFVNAGNTNQYDDISDAEVAAGEISTARVTHHSCI